MAMKMAPGTSAATVTGIHTCWLRRSIWVDELALHVPADGRASSAISRPRSPAPG